MLNSINLAIFCKTIFIEKYGYESVQQVYKQEFKFFKV